MQCPKSKSPGPSHPQSNRALGEKSAGNQTACDTPSKSCPLEPSAGRTCSATIRPWRLFRPVRKPKPRLPIALPTGSGTDKSVGYADTTTQNLPFVFPRAGPIKSETQIAPRRTHPQSQLRENRCALRL